MRTKLPAAYVTSWRDYIPVAIFAGALLTIILFNPLAQNYDKYLAILKLSIAQGVNLAGSRPIFISSTNTVSKFLSLDIAFIDRNLYIALFLASTLIFYDYIKRNISSKYLGGTIYLSLLIPSVILMQINETIPQVVLVILSIPVLLLAVESIKSDAVWPAIVALAFSIVALLFHPLSAVLLAVPMIALGLILGRSVFKSRRISWQLAIVVIIILVASYLFFGHGKLLEPSIAIFDWMAHSFSGIHWQWSFLSRYEDFDKTVISYTGLNVGFYYLYNGAVLLVLLVYLAFIRQTRPFRKNLYYLLPAFYFSCFILIAEFLPRLGLFFLPSRAWLHMMVSVVILLALLAEDIGKKGLTIRWLPYILSFLIILGFCGSLYLVNFNIKKVYQEELAVVKHIKYELPVDSIIVSSQDNLALVYIYAQRDYGKIKVDTKIDRDEFDRLIEAEIRALMKNKFEVLQPKVNQILEIPALPSAPVYFLYSYRKIDVLNNAKIDRQTVVDPINRDTYDKLGYPIIYSSQDAILIKIK